MSDDKVFPCCHHHEQFLDQLTAIVRGSTTSAFIRRTGFPTVTICARGCRLRAFKKRIEELQQLVLSSEQQRVY